MIIHCQQPREIKMTADNIKYHYDMVQGTQEWKDIRKGILTASEVKSLITPTGKVASNNDSRGIIFDILAQRLNPNDDEPEFSNSHMERGNTFEPFARDLYSEKSNQVKECGFITREFDGFKIGFSPDGLVGDDGIIEIKCPTKKKHVKEICLGDKPNEHMMQIQTGLLVTGRDWCDFISHYNGMHQRVYRVRPDLALHDKILESCRALESSVDMYSKIYKDNVKMFNKAKYEEAI